ncbi:MAG: cupredoxin domain-containing protein [Beijerinckiaceae bacterium]|nr:cupredoxin domain-containing protein [Beijerinckiaceae bacterium]MCI0736673.1 cupredoxin domain-containing protein [Beijerinckiaceae bacterium]
MPGRSDLRKLDLILPAVLLIASGAAVGRAEEEAPRFTIEFKDGSIAPQRLEVPANRRFQLQLRNSGDTPAEFESTDLRKEKVLAPKSTAILVFRTLDPGEYAFFDEFHPDAPKAVLIAK